MTDPTLLRRAIETVGIEKPSDYTLVLEEVERLMDGRLVEKVARALNHVECEPHKDVTGYGDTFGWEDVMSQVRERHLATSRTAIEASGLPALIRAATDLVQEMEEMGYGKTSDRALPG